MNDNFINLEGSNQSYGYQLQNAQAVQNSQVIDNKLNVFVECINKRVDLSEEERGAIINIASDKTSNILLNRQNEGFLVSLKNFMCTFISCQKECYIIVNRGQLGLITTGGSAKIKRGFSFPDGKNKIYSSRYISSDLQEQQEWQSVGLQMYFSGQKIISFTKVGKNKKITNQMVSQNIKKFIRIEDRHETFDTAVNSIALLEERVRLIGKFLSKLADIHKNEIIHRDIKYNNLLFPRNSKGQYDVIICDFGAAITSNTYWGYRGKGAATTMYMAPEEASVVLNSNNNREALAKIETSSMDDWCAGIVAYGIYFLANPPHIAYIQRENLYDKRSIAFEVSNYNELPMPHPLQRPYEYLIWEMMRKDPADRVPVKKISAMWSALVNTS